MAGKLLVFKKSNQKGVGKMKKLMVLVVLCVLAFGGCALTTKEPTVAELAAANYGIAPENPKELAMAHLKNTLFDSMSAVVEWQGECVKGWWQLWESESLLVPPKTYFGWTFVAKINAKNRMGGYVGFQNYKFCFRDGKLVHVIS
jgi:hypothetical protein